MIPVSSSTELLSKLSELDVQMVLLSHKKGQNTVFGLAEKIRESEKNKKVKLILISAGISRNEVEMAFRSGINDIIAEPFNPSVQTWKLENALIGEQKSVESRRFFRKKMSDKITVEVECDILDISEGGMRIGTNMVLKIGEVIRFELQLFRDLGFGGKPGKVVWVSKEDSDEEHEFQAGVDFIDFTRSQRDRLRDWIMNSETRSQGLSPPSRRAMDTGSDKEK
jgi:CheY-like chemotaxis protein